MLTFSGKFPVTEATVSTLTGPQMIIFIQTEQMVRWYYLRLSRPIMSLYTRERKRKRRGRKRRRWGISKIQKGGKVRCHSKRPQTRTLPSTAWRGKRAEEWGRSWRRTQREEDEEEDGEQWTDRQIHFWLLVLNFPDIQEIFFPDVKI